MYTNNEIMNIEYGEREGKERGNGGRERNEGRERNSSSYVHTM